MLQNFWTRSLVALPLCVAVSFGANAGSAADEVPSEFLGSGLTRMSGGYSPIRSVMDLSAEVAKTPPADLKNPKYGRTGRIRWRKLEVHPG